MPKPYSTRSRPGAHWYIVAAVLIGMGPIALVWSLWTGAGVISGANHRFTAPGFVAVQITAPGEYSLWRILDQETTAPIPENIRITIVEPTQGAEFDLEPIPGAPERIGRRERVEIARTRLPHPGPIEIIVEGEFQPGVFEFGPSIGSGLAGGGLVTPRLAEGFGTGALVLNTLLFGSLSFVGIIAGVAIIVIVWIARDRSPTADH